MGLPQAWSSQGFRRLEDLLLSIEREISLLGAFSPTNFGVEVARLSQELSLGRVATPRFVYRNMPVWGRQSSRIKERLKAVEIALSSVSTEVPGGAEELLGRILAERVMELQLELQLVSARGTDEVVSLGRRRYSFATAELEAADTLAAEWFSCKLEAPRNDESELLSSLLSRLCSARGYSVRIVEGDIASIAAVADDCLIVRRGAAANANEAARLFAHEVEGHLMPRMRAASGPIPLRIGTGSSVEDEEGRALLLEERSGNLGSQRRHWLSVRHQLARAVRDGQSGPDVALRLALAGADVALVASELCRTLRGGGLAREIVYLPGYLRVRAALLEHPEDEDWMSFGRVSVRAARELSLLQERNP
jgi:hypothetical protein